MSNIFTAIFSFFTKVFTPFFGATLASSLSTSIENLAKDAVGKLAIDAVQYVQAALPGASSEDKKAAAVAKLKTDLVSVGKDAEQFGESVLNLLVELGVQYVTKYLPAPVLVANAAATEAETITATAEAHFESLPETEAEAYFKTLPYAVQQSLQQHKELVAAQQKIAAESAAQTEAK